MNISQDQLLKLASAYDLLDTISSNKAEEHGDMDEKDLACNAYSIIRKVFDELGVVDQYGNLLREFDTDALVKEVYKSGYRRMGKPNV